MLFARFTLHRSSEDLRSGTAGLNLGGSGGLLLTTVEYVTPPGVIVDEEAC